jgi:hypothetical protein
MMFARSGWHVLAVAIVAAACGASCSSSTEAGNGDSGVSSPDSAGGHDGGEKKDTGFVSHDAGSMCGGRTGNPCGDGAKCVGPSDCQSGLCVDLRCVAPPTTCTDATKDGKETDVDCGGGACPACAAGKDCGSAADCVSLVCTTGGKCLAASPTDSVRNDSETDKDCGGALQASGKANPLSDGAPACAVGKLCLLPNDCAQGVCSATPTTEADGGAGDAGSTKGDGGADPLRCQPASPHDGVINDSETDTDCGGGFSADGTANPASDGAPVCTHGQSCLLGTDCDAGVCNANKDQGGGPINCPTKGSCVCQLPAANDGVQNSTETGVDCGGDDQPGSDGAPPCAPGTPCGTDGNDCSSGICSGGVCTISTPTDTVMNGGETDVDCGGNPSPSTCVPTDSADCAPPCGDNLTCGSDSDCLSGYCSLLTLKCVDGQSCKGLVTPAAIMHQYGTVAMDGTTTTTVAANGDAVGQLDSNGYFADGSPQHAGIDNCGPGESTDPIASQQHESCCKSLLLPGSTTTRVDKYIVTSGRIRQFLQALDYDVRDWAIAQFDASWNPITAAGTNMAAQMPINDVTLPASPTGTPNMVGLLPHSNDTSEPLNAVIVTGALVVDTSGDQGCFTGEGYGGAATYWWDADTLAVYGSPPRPFTQDVYDSKPMNCIPYYLAVAFCAWDGGRLITQPEHATIWGSGPYPWAGTSILPAPYPGNQAITGLAACGPLRNDSVNCTVDWFDGGQGAGTQGDFYYYPSWVDNVPNEFVPSTLDNTLDLTPYIAAPGRFYLDRSVQASTSFGDGEGWQDIGANMLELAPGSPPTTGSGSFCDESGVLAPGESYNCGTNGILRASNLPATNILGGSWEGHGPQETYADLPNYWSAYRQYGKTGIRCAREAEPAP